MKFAWLEITGFRSFSVTQRMDFTKSIGLVWGGNSQGKTAIAEAVEFLITGDTVRRAMLGGDRTEYHSSLRCAHHPAGDGVKVAAGIFDAAGRERRVERVLDQDYARGQECATTLTIDGVVHADLASLGIVLAEPPLRAPVLFQHSVRYALSARPSDRLAYFKALLELADVDAFADGVQLAVKAIAVEPTSRERDLAVCLGETSLSSALAPLRTFAPGATSQASLRDAVVVALGALGEPTPPATLPVADVANLLDAVLDRIDQRRFDFAAWRPGRDRPAVTTPDLGDVEGYSRLARAIDVGTGRLAALFEAVLAVPAFDSVETSVDCPVCGTEDALTPQRTKFLREQLSETQQFRASQQRAGATLSTLHQTLVTALTASKALAPPIASADVGAIETARGALSRVLGTEVDIAPSVEKAHALRGNAEKAGESLEAAIAVTSTASALVKEGRPVDGAALAAAVASAITDVDLLPGHRTEFIDVARVVLAPAKEILDREAGNTAYRVLGRLARAWEALDADRKRRAAVERVRAEYETAARDIEQAKLAVFNTKFASMSDEISRWWQLLRPDEPVEFHRAAPRGAGRRAMTLEAVLHGKDDDHVVRDAIGVLSDSQLNALGLSAFLARASLQRNPFIVLDDPVQSGDEAHRDTFIDYVVPALATAGFQVLVTTFDHGFRSLMTKAHDPDSFQVDLDDPTRGSVVVSGAHSAVALLNDAKSFIQEGQSLRAVGAGRLRVAAEAVAKEILVTKRSAAGERASLADYTKWALEKLVVKLNDHLAEKDRRWWSMVSERLSPGAHDDAPPEKNTLKAVYDGLKTSMKEYCP